MVLVEGWIVAKMGVTPQSVGLMIAYNVAWTAGAIILGETLFGSNTQDNLTYVGEGSYCDSSGQLWQVD